MLEASKTALILKNVQSIILAYRYKGAIWSNTSKKMSLTTAGYKLIH